MSNKCSHPSVICLCEICGETFHPPKSSVGPGLTIRPGTGKYCSRKCSGIGRRGERIPIKERFWNKVNKDGPIPVLKPELGPCWVWTRSLRTGYGMFGSIIRPLPAHRVSYEWEFGPIPENILVRHQCDNRTCVRPSHLCLGDAVANALDWVERGVNPSISRIMPKPTIQERFWAKVNKTGPIPIHCPDIGHCWIWTGAKDYGRYGKFGNSKIGTQGGRSTIPAHRFSWELVGGKIPDGMIVLHRCDTPSCVRAEHLFIGSTLDNVLDKLAKGRSNQHRKITEDAVREIRIRYSLGETQRILANEFNISQPTVSNIVRRRIWAHVN